MKYEYAKSFIRDTKKVPEDTKSGIKSLVESVGLVEHFGQLSNVKKMKGYSNAFRIRIGDYRVGVLLEEDNLILTRVLHRKEIYKYFP
ncbi:type II toxin-antitoxin system RelE family toxin [Dyadobacter arcticus]|uniref:mRNA interferase RelE/StbE n=1 Tax=Dyadobacter arcticus TaxID=1078754 RepID=A0ABX0UQW5_9BACT|nr:type II toxin-antitoxin system RelE/ParE family toxin [Dyadobacter arcticus]NIJ53391.1 mRNA interferase RelE/StbE [Dyadobacter arcticus]